MFSNIKEIFFKNNNNKEEHKKIKDDVNSITILLDSNNEPYIHIAISDLDPGKAIHFGKILSELNSGYYVSTMTDILLKLSKEDETIKFFIGKILSSWSLYNQLHSSFDNDPIIKPTDFVKSIRNE